MIPPWHSDHRGRPSATRLHGRDRELKRLIGLVASAKRSLEPSACFVHGAPGAGKTRLLREVAANAEADRLFWVTGHQPESGVALAAADQLFAELGKLAGSDVRLDSLLGISRPRDQQATPVQLFEAVHRVLAGTDGVNIFLVDDVQWIDETTLALLHYLARAAPATYELAMVTAGRDTPRAWTFAQSIERLCREQFEWIEIGPLGPADGTRLARQLDPNLSSEAATELWRRASGSPFWIEALAASRVAGTDPTTVVSALLRTIGEDGTTLVQMLALAGRPLITDELAELMTWSQRRATRTIEETSAAGLAIENESGVKIAHELIRQAVIDRMPGSRIRRSHRRLALWFEQNGADDIRMALAALGHRKGAGLPLAEAAVNVCRSPRRRMAGQEGLRLLASIALAAHPTEPLAAELRYQVGLLAGELGEHEIEFSMMAELTEMITDPSRMADAALRASRALLNLSRTGEAQLYLERAHHAGSGDPVAAVGLAAQGANLARIEGKLDAAFAAATFSLEQSRQLPPAKGGTEEMRQRRARLDALLASADVAIATDDPPAMLSLGEEIANVAAGFDDRTHVGGLVAAALACRFLGRNSEAEARTRRAWDEARQQILPQAILEAGAALGGMLVSLGRLREAKGIADEMEALGSRLAELVPARAYMVVLPHLIELEVGDWRAASAALQKATATNDLPHYTLQGHLERAAALSRLDPTGARRAVIDEVRAAVGDAERVGCRRCRIESGIRGAEALARVGARLDGSALLEATPDPHPEDALLGWWRARAEWYLDRPAQPITRLRELAGTAESQGLTIESLRTRLDVGSLLIEVDRSRAAAELRGVGAAAERLGATTIRRGAEQGLRSLGVRTWRRDPSVPAETPFGGLTARELEVAVLAASGASNPEIAASLFLSRKTVERHLSNIYAKLGARNRTELAALVASEEGPQVEGVPR